MKKLREVLNRLACNGNSAATATLDRDTAQVLYKLLGAADIFRAAAEEHIDRSGKRPRVDRNMSSHALDALGQVVTALDEIDQHEVDLHEWHRSER